MSESQNAKSPSSAFGHAGRYYAAERAAIYARQRPPTDLERRFAEFLQHHDPHLKATVERTFKQWNNILRDYLRSETGLRLTVGDDVTAVPVHAVDGLPKPMADILKEFDPQIWRLLLNHGALASACQGVNFLQAEFDWINELEGVAPSPAAQRDVSNTAVLLGLLLEFVQKLGIEDQLKTIHQDILGAYFFREPEVHLYWMVIGFIAGLTGVSVDALTVVVVTHELAHAYTHLGRDIDGERWATGAFASADAALVEGLAQFYTSVVCQKLEPRFPAAQQAYRALLELQSGPYVAHNAWDTDAQAVGEAVRVSMLRCRSNAIGTSDQFSSFLKEYLKQLKREKKTPPASSPGR